MANMTDSQYYQVCSLLLFLSTMQFYYIFNKHLQHITHPKLPPSPPSLPVVGHLHLVWPSLYKSLQNLSTQYGPIFNFRLGFSQCIVVTSALVGTEIFKLMIFLSQNIQGQVSQRKIRLEALDFSVPHMVIIGGSSRNCA